MPYSQPFRARVLEEARPEVRKAFPLLWPILAAILPKLIELIFRLIEKREVAEAHDGPIPRA